MKESKIDENKINQIIELFEKKLQLIEDNKFYRDMVSKLYEKNIYKEIYGILFNKKGYYTCNYICEEYGLYDVFDFKKFIFDSDWSYITYEYNLKFDFDEGINAD